MKLSLKGHGLRKYPIVKFFINFLKPQSVIMEGSILYLNRKDNSFLQDARAGSYDPEETKMFKDIVRQGDLVIDIGANIGYFSLLSARLGATVIAFEPEVENFRCLTKNIKENGLASITAYNVGLSDKSEGGRIYLNDYNMGDHRTFDSHNGRESYPIQLKTLDEMCQGLLPRLVKIDTQGAEPKILKGGSRILKNTEYLLIEYSPYHLEKAGSSGAELVSLIRSLGFSFIQDLAQYTAQNQGMTNILAKRENPVSL